MVVKIEFVIFWVVAENCAASILRLMKKFYFSFF
jgi:hypothetical protein